MNVKQLDKVFVSEYRTCALLDKPSLAKKAGHFQVFVTSVIRHSCNSSFPNKKFNGAPR